MNSIHEQLFSEAYKSTVDHQYSAIIFHRKQILSIGHNRNLVHSSDINQCLLRA
jgi:hypothetical protein